MKKSATTLGLLRATGLALALAVPLTATPDRAAAQQTAYAIPASPLEQALNRFATESGVQLIYDSTVVAGRQSPGVQGQATRDEALGQVLSGTGLTYRFTGDRTVIIEVAATAISGDGGTLVGDDIIVTARRTEEALQDVPASVLVFSGEDVERSNLKDADDLSLLTPNVDFTANDNPARIFFSIRGLSDLNAVSTGPTIGFFQDGVLQNNTGQVITVNRRLVDVERVEVLYGPQGTSFGRGTVGGAINVVTAKPTNEFEASLTTEFGSNFDFTGEAVLNLPLTDDLAVRGVLFGNYDDGFIDAPFAAGADSIGNSSQGGRAAARYTPSDRLTLDAMVEYSEQTIDAPSFGISSSVFEGDPITLIGTFDDLEIDRLNIRGEAAYDFDFGTLTFTTAFNRATFFGGEDFDLTPPNNAVIERSATERSISQELRFESEDFTLPDDMGEISFNVGFIYTDAVREGGPEFNTVFFGGGGNVTSGRTDLVNLGIFGDVRWKPIEDLELAVGARFSRDKVSVFSQLAPNGSLLGFAQPTQFLGDGTFFSVTPNASINYDWTENFSTYFSFSTGYRPGGFVSTLTAGVIEFEEENVRSFEGGFKSSWLDDRLLLVGSGFALFYDDIQVPISQAFGGGIENAASARSIGAEVTVGAMPLDGLSLEAGLGLAFTKFTDFAQSVSGDQTGERLPRAPRASLTFTGEYEHPDPVLYGFSPFARVEYSYRTDYSAGVGANNSLGGFDVTNFRFGVRSENVDVTLFVENLFGEEYVTEAFAPAAIAVPQPPAAFAGQASVVPGATRRFGLEAKIKF